MPIGPDTPISIYPYIRVEASDHRFPQVRHMHAPLWQGRCIQKAGMQVIHARLSRYPYIRISVDLFGPHEIAFDMSVNNIGI